MKWSFVSSRKIKDEVAAQSKSKETWHMITFNIPIDHDHKQKYQRVQVEM
jgi:hypothetical protein